MKSMTISHEVNLNVRYAPICCMTIQEVEDCRNITLTCNCDAVPADITQYLFFNGGSEIYDGANNTFTLSVAYGNLSSFSCSATNSIGPGNKTDAKNHKCDEGTTALPTTTIVTTAPLSTNEPTSNKAMVTTTEEPKDGYPKNPGKCGSKSDRSNIDNGIVNDGMEISPPIYAEMKKKSDKPDDNGAGPGVDPEIPAYGVIDKNRTKDPTPAPLSSMRDSTNSSKHKQDGPMKMQYADLDHGNNPPSDEVRKPKEEPTEYATVQPVIV